MALQWKDIDFEKNEIHVYKALESGSTNIKGPKTQAGVRDIPIHAELLPKLKAAQKGPFDFVLQDTKGRPLTNITKQRMWDSFKYQMDVNMGAKRKRSAIVESKMAPDFNVYCLRHTFCTDLQRAGVPINVAKELMGHANISVTANIYTHRDAKTLHDNIQKLSEWKNGEGGKERGKVEHETAKAQ
jgi:integrase